MAVLTAKNLYFSFGRKTILEDISFTLGVGEILGIVGPNGGGKSSLLKIIVGHLPKDRGSLSFSGKPSPEKGELAYLSFEANFNNRLPLTCSEFISLGAIYTQSSKKMDIGEALDCVDLGHKAQTPVEALSDGEKQRMALARCYLQSPRIFVFDEPSKGLDTAGEDCLFEFLHRARKRGQSALVVDHNMGQLLKHCDNIICLNKTIHWHRAREDLREGATQEKHYHCEFEHGLLHEREGPGLHKKYRGIS